MRMKTILLAFVAACLVSPLRVQANPEKPDSTAYQYAILFVNEPGFRTNPKVTVVYENGFVEDLTAMIEERAKAKKISDGKSRTRTLMVMEAFKHLDRHGYELAGSSVRFFDSINRTDREYVFRKKRPALSVQ